MTAVPASGGANPWAALGLPPTWAPAPFALSILGLRLDTPTGPDHFHVLVFDSERGRLAFAFTNDQARALVDQLSAQISGITVARTMPPPSNGSATP